MPTYKNGNYLVTILEDGTKIRRTPDDDFIPDFSENCDMKITDKCSQKCPFCYEGCTEQGKHADLFKFDFVKHLHPYTELALNGNDMDHPQLKEFLELLKSQHVYANITVNQNQFMKNFDLIKSFQEDKLVYGIGVSLNHVSYEFIDKFKQIKNGVLHTIIGILTEDEVNQLKDNDLKILLLGYKELQRGVSFLENNKDSVEKNSKFVYDNLDKFTSWFKVVSFDNLAIKQLDVKRIVPENEWEEFYMGDDGGYTFYIDMVKGEFSKNSVAKDRYPIGDKSIDDMFNFIRTLNK